MVCVEDSKRLKSLVSHFTQCMVTMEHHRVNCWNNSMWVSPGLRVSPSCVATVVDSCSCEEKNPVTLILNLQPFIINFLLGCLMGLWYDSRVHCLLVQWVCPIIPIYCWSTVRTIWKHFTDFSMFLDGLTAGTDCCIPCEWANWSRVCWTGTYAGTSTSDPVLGYLDTLTWKRMFRVWTHQIDLVVFMDF